MSCFSQALLKSESFHTLLRAVEHRRLPAGVTGLSPVGKTQAVCTIMEHGAAAHALILTHDEAAATRAAADYNTMAGREGAFVYPARDLAFRDVSGQSREYEQARLGVLARMVQGEYEAVFCPIDALVQLTIPPEELVRRSHVLHEGEEIGADALAALLMRAGYTRSAQVDGIGLYSVRGGIVDFYPPELKQPVRVELFGDEIDTLSAFDVETQRRGERLQAVSVTPVREILFDSPQVLAEKIRAFSAGLKGKAVKAREQLNRDLDWIEASGEACPSDKYLPLAYSVPATVGDYLPGDGMLFVFDSGDVARRARDLQKLMNEEIKALFEDGVLCKGLDNYSIDFNRVTALYERFGAVYMDTFARGSFDTPVRELVTLSCRRTSPWNGSVQALRDDLIPLLKQDYTCVVLAGTEKGARAVAQELEQEAVRCTYYASLPGELPPHSVSVLPGALSGGVEYDDIRLSITTYSRAATVRRRARTRTEAKNRIHSLEELHRGDYIVHNVHGIGVFEGIHKLDVNGVTKDYIKIRYLKDDILYVPVTQLDLVSKYIAPGEDGSGKLVRLNRLGGTDWSKTRSRVRAAVQDMARELTALYASRMSTPGYAFSPDSEMQRDFESRFEYDETDDQLRCIHEIKKDMERPHPMDRLLCGDVGFGKTEVALRAAFKCIADGKQCAILVPTTILAFQHYQTVLRRFEGFPIEAVLLSRFTTPRESRRAVDGLRRGSVDLVVGTHRLISKDIRFKDLGLLIIDEEQRFGVAQKEKLKQLFPTVDVLTLSATPIPRTLNMAMSGIRDMSIIEEAPMGRFPVQTYVIEHDEGVLREAMERELRRGGQVYYLHNRIDTISQVAERITRLLPASRVATAHGRMSEEELSSVWRELMEGEIDILVCTTIIETGVDVQNVNTLIIEDADRMGLAQLHQIRGRVGRSSRRASAYFTFHRDREMTQIAASRLAAIQEYTQFGSGFQIAMRDLEIRGAGSVLGAQQHGHMEAVGYEMYLRMLSDAVLEQKGEKPAEKKECLIDLQIQAHIPEQYIGSVPQRLNIYRRIADVRTQEDASDVVDELIDRFGDPPASVEGLIRISLMRNTAAALGVYEVTQRGEQILLYFNTLDLNRITLLSQALPRRVKVGSGKKAYIAVRLAGERPEEVLEQVLRALDGGRAGEKGPKRD